MQTKPLFRAGAAPAIPRPTGRRPGRRFAIAAIAALCLGPVAAPAAASADPSSLFWVDQQQRTVGGSALDGSSLNGLLIDRGHYKPDHLTVAGGYLYWTDPSLGAIGRSKLDGSEVTPRFIANLGNDVTSLAVTATHVYWGAAGNQRRIGRIALDGTGRNDAFITGLPGDVSDLSASSTHLYWSWTNDAFSATHSATAIGRAALDGTGVNATLVQVEDPTGVSDDPRPSLLLTGTHVYWTDQHNDRIGRAKLDGSSISAGFLTGIEGQQGSQLVSDGTYLYWRTLTRDPISDQMTGRLGRAKLDGTGLQLNHAMDPSLLIGYGEQGGLATTATQVYWTPYAFSQATVGRITTSGTGLNGTFMTDPAPGLPQDVVADETNVYWIDGPEDNYIARAKRDGSDLNLRWADLGGPAYSLAVDKAYLYWRYERTTYEPDETVRSGIGRTRIDGTGSDASFITGTSAYALATTATHLYWSRHLYDPTTNTSRDVISRADIDGTDIVDAVVDTGPVANYSTIPSLEIADGTLYWLKTSETTEQIGKFDLTTGARNDNLVSLPAGTGTTDFAVASGNLFLSGPGLTKRPLDGSALPTMLVPSSVQVQSLAIAREDLPTPTPPPPPPSPTPSTPTPPAPETTPTPPSSPIASPPPSSGSGGVTPPVKVRPAANLRARKAKRGSTLFLSLTGVAKGTKLTVTWKPKRGRATRATYPARGTSLKIKVPKKAGRYTLTVRQGKTTLLKAQVTAQ